MVQQLAHIAILVRDYDEAISFYTEKLGFTLIEDSVLSESKRWVVVAPKGPGSCSLLLAKASGEAQEKSIGNQAGGRVFLFLHTDDIRRDHAYYKANGIRFIKEPVTEAYGTVAIFSDLYGNLWDLIEPAKK